MIQNGKTVFFQKCDVIISNDFIVQIKTFIFSKMFISFLEIDCILLKESPCVITNT